MKKSGKILIVLSLVLAGFLLVDYASRFFLSSGSPVQKKYPVEIYRKAKPYIMFGGAPFGVEGKERLNLSGYRGKYPAPVKEPGEFRIFVLGASTVVDGEPPIPQLLENKFRQSGFNNVNVYNFGVVSSCSGQDLARILFQVSDLKPDLIIMYNGDHDMEGPYFGDPRPGYPFNFIAYENNPILDSQIRNYPLTTLILYGSNLLRHFFPDFFLRRFVPLEQERMKAGYYTPAWENEIAGLYVANLKKASLISKSFGADFIAFFQPTLAYKNTLSPEEEYSLHRLKDYNQKYLLDMRRLILAKIEAAKTTGVKIVDLSDVYVDNPNWIFIDSCHTRQEGKPIVADRIFEAIEGYKLIAH